MELTDTHCHLFLPEFDTDRADAIDRAVESGVTRMFLPNVDHSTADALLRTCDEYPDHCFPMMGLHPTSVNGSFEHELRQVEEWFDHQKFHAVGEIGIDLYWDRSFREQQEEAFLIQLGWASDRNLPVVIHVRESYRETIQVIRESRYGNLRGIFHCFSGTREQAEEILGLGFYLGIGGLATFKNGGLDRVLPGINPASLVLETDSPYLAPVPFRGKRNEPSYLLHVATRVAAIYGMSTEELAETTTLTSKQLFGI